MRKILTRSIVVISVILLAVSMKNVYGATKSVTSGSYTYRELTDGTIELVSYTGKTENVTVPAMIDGKEVKKILNDTFYNLTTLKTVKISEGIEYIDMYAFSKCANLTNVIFPNSTKYISRYFYKSCPKIKYTIPSHLTKMEEGSYIEVATVTLNGTREYDLALEVLSLVNEERAKRGLSPLEYSVELTEVAMKRAAETSVYWSHIRPCGMDCFTISSIFDGENIGAKTASPQKIMSSWMNSALHRAAILNSSYKSIGIGCYKINGVTYWVQTFSVDKSSNSKQVTGSKQHEDKINISTNGEKIVLNIYGLSEQINLNIGDTIQATKVSLTNTTQPDLKTQIALSDVTWSSSDEKVFTVDKNGKIAAVGGGSATLTAKLGNVIHSATVTVNSALQSISLPNSIVCYKGREKTLNLAYIPSTTTDDKTAIWTIKDSNIATINQDGVITGKSVGTTIVTAKVGEKIATCVVTVEDYVEEDLYFSNKTETVVLDTKSKKLDIIFKPGTDTKDQTISWYSSDSNVATVDENGLIKVLSTGKVTITATTKNGNEAKIEVNVIDYLLGDLNFDGVVNSIDAAMALDLYNSGIITKQQVLIGDVNLDGVINSSDAAMILDMYNNAK